MLSRVAESIYWMARYMERAENYARFIDTNLHLTLDGATNQWLPLVLTTGDHEVFEERYGVPSRENVLRFLAFDREYGNSILNCVIAARENARSVREVITVPMFEMLNEFYLELRQAEMRADDILLQPQPFIDSVKRACQLFTGVTRTTLSRGDAWHFSELGYTLERADKTSRILDVKYFIILPSLDEVGAALDTLQWNALLNSASALQMYRQKEGLISPGQVADFLIFDREFPRAIMFCVAAAERSLHRITGNDLDRFTTPAEKVLGQLRSELTFCTIEDVFQEGLHEFLDRQQNRLNEVGESIHGTFFDLLPVTPAPPKRHSELGVTLSNTQKMRLSDV